MWVPSTLGVELLGHTAFCNFACMTINQHLVSKSHTMSQLPKSERVPPDLILVLESKSKNEALVPVGSSIRVSQLVSKSHTMSQQQESEGVQLDHSLSSKSNCDNVPRDSAEEGPRLTEAQIAVTEFGTGVVHRKYQQLYLAAQRGDWKSAKSFIDNDPNALTARVAMFARTVLHVAAQSCQWGFLLELLKLVSAESVAMQDSYGGTVLHSVARGGSLKTAKALIKKNPGLPQICDDKGELPLLYSINSKKKELVWYLSSITRLDSRVPSLPNILGSLIRSGFHDIALYLVRRHPESALAKNEDGTSLVWWLASTPSHFKSGSNLGFLERWMYKLLRWFNTLLWKAIAQLAPSIKIVRDAKLKHECAVQLVDHVCNQLSSMSFNQINKFFTSPKLVILAVVEGGIEEFVRTLFQHFPDTIYYRRTPNGNILQTAIEFRQEKIYNIIKEISPTITKVLCAVPLESGNRTLHLAGKLAPSSKLYSVSGAAFQMQRELQWFKEVEKITFVDKRESRNDKNETAKDVFRREHKELAEQGEKWMKDTANSCMLVSTLIATVLFAAVYTVPGGNMNDKGIPIFLHMNAFMVFAISDALGLFSSLTSLLMFLAILTARYEVDDFLKSLPKKLIIGLGSLFFAIATMIIAFGATLTIVLSERWHWISLPVTLLASLPVVVFVMLQLPLFIQMVQSTYGSNIFRPWPSRYFE